MKPSRKIGSKVTILYISALYLSSLKQNCAHACTNILVTRGASSDGSSMISYNADSGNLMGLLYHYPEIKADKTKKNIENVAMRQVYDWDSGRYLGEIPEASRTYNVVGNTNAMGLTIAETTFGGIEALSNQPDAILDYGSLIYIALQRAATAREAIKTMTDLMDTYGYASEGESFSLSDSTTGEVWMMEVIARGGSNKKGAVWVALKIPDGAVAAHANQARITTFPRNDPANCLYAHDVVDMAVELGLYTRIEGDTDDSLFSFSDVYDPLTFSGARHGEARVWSIFLQIAESEFEEKYFDYAYGKNLKNRMPLYVFPKEKLSLHQMDRLMSSHFEETKLSMENDVGAGEYSSPYRTRPLVWKYNDRTFTNERPIATQQTGWNFIAQMRPYASSARTGNDFTLTSDTNTRITASVNQIPQYISSILWFGVDDSSTAPRVPVYGCSTQLSKAYVGKGPQDGVPSPLLDFDIEKAFWVQNMVSNFVYTRWNQAYPILRQKLTDVLESFIEAVKELDEKISELALEDLEEGIKIATAFTVKAGDALHKLWWKVYGELFSKYRDMFVIEENTNHDSGINVKEVGFSDHWKETIVADVGDFVEVPSDTTGDDHSNVDKDDDSQLSYIMLRGALYDVTNVNESRETLLPINKLKIQGL